jgi:type II secretion system (T2SS) protein F
MTLVGAVAAGVAVMLALVGGRGSSAVARRLRAIDARPRITTRPALWSLDLAHTKVACAIAAALFGAALAGALAIGPLPIVAVAYVGYIAPSLREERAAAGRRRDADHAIVTLVEWLHALVACGRPLETAIAGMAARASGSSLLDVALDGVRRDYALGVPMHQALSRHGRATGVTGLVELASRLERARDLGRGALPLLQDLRDDLRAAERSRALRAASGVEGKLTLVMTLCYLPALALLVIVPLFLTLLSGLFG